MSKILMEGTEPIGQVADLTADNLNPTSTYGNIVGQWKKMGKIAFVSGGLEMTQAIGGGGGRVVDLGVTMPSGENANWVGTRVSGNNTYPLRGYIVGDGLYVQSNLSQGDVIIISCVFSIQ